ncbi:MAG: hypothetical protein ACRELB_19560, partial [Polyangiaceae bacterium]
MGDWMAHQSLTLPDNPAVAAFDGFDLATNWVPPFSAQVLGGNPGDSIVTTYLTLASNAADTATTAAQTALDDLIQAESDQATQEAAVAKSSLSVQQAADALCGAGNASCVTTGQMHTVADLGYPTLDPGNSDPGASEIDQMNAFVFQLVNPMYQMQFWVSDPVFAYIQSGTAGAPQFQSYAGGSLQQAFIDEWIALEAPIQQIQALQSAAQATADAWLQADTVLLNASVEVIQECSGNGFLDALLSCFTVGLSGGSGGVGVGISFNGGPLVAHGTLCDNLTTQAFDDYAADVTAEGQAFAAIASDAVGFTTAMGNMTASAAKVQGLAQTSQQATASAQLEASLAVRGNVTSFGLYREYTDDELWRAMALLENARVYALAARRAVEAQYIVNLSELSQPEAFVASPATWADEIYSYDLSLPSSVGLQVPGAQSGSNGSGGSAIYVNKVKDYVTNLQDFVNGFAVSRPSAVASADLDLVTLPGLSRIAPDILNPAIFPNMAAWSLHCPADGSATSDKWVSVSDAVADPDHACANGGHPDTAAISFTLDPWARLDGYIANPPVNNRYNARWTQLAVNFVGTGIKNCVVAADPAGC